MNLTPSTPPFFNHITRLRSNLPRRHRQRFPPILKHTPQSLTSSSTEVSRIDDNASNKRNEFVEVDEIEDSISRETGISAADQFEVEYARYVNYPPINGLISTHQCLIPQTEYFRRRFRSGAWLKLTDFGVFVRIVPERSTGSDDAILMVYHRYKVLEEHYVSRMHFSWPQVTCISGFPARGTRSVIISYKDGGNSDQIQKFALRFSTTNETEKFISDLKDSLEDTSPEVSNAMFGGVSSQQEIDPSNFPTNKSFDESWISGVSLDSSSHYIPTTTYPSPHSIPTTTDHSSPYIPTTADHSSHYVPTTTDHEAAHASNGLELVLSNKAEEIISTFSPSFTSFLMNCCPTAEQGATKPTISEEADFKDQLMMYMKDPSFQDILAKAEQLITELGDDMQFP